jgi:hypothetical protein
LLSKKANPGLNAERNAAYIGWRKYLYAPFVQSVLSRSFLSNDLTLQEKIMINTIAKNTHKPIEIRQFVCNGGRVLVY